MYCEQYIVFLIVFLVHKSGSSNFFSAMSVTERKLKVINASLANNDELCLGVRFKQLIVHEKCIPAVISNKMCIGSCRSVSIPSTKGKIIRKFRSCMEDKSVIVEVKLECPSRKRRFKKKKVKLVKTCKCRNVDVIV